MFPISLRTLEKHSPDGLLRLETEEFENEISLTMNDSSLKAKLDSLELPGAPRGYQLEGIKFLSESPNALLADGMGLGKTIQCILALRILFSQRTIRRVLIVVPASLKRNWSDELSAWAGNLYCRDVGDKQRDRLVNYRLPIPVLFASYEQVRMDVMANRVHNKFDVVILDEAQRIKNKNSTTSLACRLIRRDWSWALTGTPIENKTSDLVALFSFCYSGLLEEHFTRMEMHKRIQPFFLRRKTIEVLTELPPIQIQDIPLDLTRTQQVAYDAVWENREALAAEGGVSSGSANLLAMITSLKQICNYDQNSDSSCKLEALRLILENLDESGEKVLIFSQYVQTLNWLSNQLRDFPHDLFHGGMNNFEKDQAIDKFKSLPGPRGLLISLKAGGVGLNLQEASVVILFDRWWNPAIENQAIARAHRMGQKLPVHVYRFEVINTVEERISRILEGKEVIFEEYVENAQNAEVKTFNNNELFNILDLSSSE